MRTRFLDLVSRLPGAVRRKVEAGKVVLSPTGRGETPLTVVESGGVGLQLEPPGVERFLLQVVGPGMSFDTVCPARADESLRTYTVIALTPTTLVEVPRHVYAGAIRANPELSGLAAAISAGRTARDMERMASLLLLPPLRRLAHTLLYVADEVGERCPLADGVHFSLTQILLAAAANLSRQTANRLLQRLRSARLAFVARSTICLTDRPGLVELAEGRATRFPHLGRPARCKRLKPEIALDCVSP